MRDDERFTMTDASLPKISVRGLTKSFGRKRVLDALDIDCATGESLVVNRC